MPFDDDAAEAARGFTLRCAGYRAAGAPDGGGRLSFSVGSQLVAELDEGDLTESWAATLELTPAETAELAEAAAQHLMELLEDGLAAADLTDAVTDAAVVFLLAMKRQGISDPKRIPACAVTLANGADEPRVILSA
jgi:hypothetical protein